MAEQTQQNVVAQPQSTDVSSSVDVSANNSTELAAAAANTKTLSSANHFSGAEPSTEEPRENNERASTVERRIASSDVITNSHAHLAEGKEADTFEEGSVRSTGVDGSIGSDTDTSKTEAVNSTGKDSDGQVPRYSAKKSASFKPVSVTKNFLAKAGSSTPVKANSERANSSASSSPVPSNSNALRPRLVAKSVGGQRGSIPKSTGLTDKSGSGSGPDPNQVWNRNRVSTPQATPKHLTDEELRQQYGIQLASRPDESDDKGAKWADIDDEEDDWAPETIEWNDGTKINLAPPEPSASVTATAEQSQKDSANEQKPDPLTKSNENVVKQTTVGPNATVLKLGAASHQKTPSVSNKGSSDKPTLVAKPSAPTPVKSPWAPLPAVDKVPLVPINPPLQQPAQPRFGQKDAHGFDAMPPPPGPQAKEIAADDFSRFSRDSTNGVPRELYVPQSGRYEPVGESRRGSARKDSTFRQPSLLQRPSPSEQQGPAEPSAAFQTNRSQQDSGAWARRRASSNVSGESGKFGRRMSFSKGLENTNPPSRRNSQFDPFAPAVPATRGPHREASPTQSLGKSIASQSPTMSSAPDSTAPVLPQDNSAIGQPVVVGAGQEDPVAIQKRLMREKREAAIKRKKEEEEREEAEKRERIRLKMEKLGLTDEKMGKKEVATPTSDKHEGGIKESDESKDNKEHRATKDNKEPTKTALQQSPPKPPVPNATGPPQQYGLIKVHPSQPLNATLAQSSLPEKSLLDPVTDGRSVRAVQAHSSLPNGDLKEPKLDSVTQSDNRPGDANSESRSWGNLPQVQTPYTNWGASGGMATHSAPGGNLWGPPTNHRALGNGDFQNNLQRPSLRPPQPPFSQQHLTSPPPQPIGTPRQAPQAGRAPTSNSSDLLTWSIIEDSQTVPAFPPIETESLQLTSHHRIEQPSAQRPANELHSISQAVNMATSNQPLSQDQQQTGRAAWANFSATVSDVERAEAKKVAQERAARLADQQLGGIVASSRPTMNETWKQVKRGDVHGTRQIVNHIKSTDNYAPSQQNQQPVGDSSKVSNASVGGHPVKSRYSDFFGQDQHGTNPAATSIRPKSPLVPPPDSLDHPAYVGITHKPLVNLPWSKPKMEKPIVKLPPISVPALKHLTRNTTEVRVSIAPVRGLSQPIVANPSWQDRFDGLLHDRKALYPEKKFADHTEFSASKEPLELNPIGTQSTAVTLPPEIGQGARDAMKSVDEENALFEERHFGSTPIIQMPAVFPDITSWEPAKEPVIPFKRAKALALKDIDVFSVPYFYPAYNEHSRGPNLNIVILFPGMADSKSKVLHRSPTRHFSRGGKPPQGKHRQSSRSAKEPLSPQGSSSRSSHSNTARSPSHNGSTPKPKTKQHTPHTTSWARRASAVAQ